MENESDPFLDEEKIESFQNDFKNNQIKNKKEIFYDA
jgi:hypothetical protein